MTVAKLNNVIEKSFVVLNENASVRTHQSFFIHVFSVNTPSAKGLKIDSDELRVQRAENLHCFGYKVFATEEY